MATPSAGANPFSGTSGRIAIATLTNDTNVDLQAIPGTFPTVTTLVEGAKWSFDESLGGPKVISFESAISAQGVLYPRQLKGGIADWNVSIEGWFNGDSGAGASTPVRLVQGSFIAFVIYLHKTQPYGYFGYGKVMSFNSGSDVENTSKPSPFSCKLAGDGAIGVGFIS